MDKTCAQHAHYVNSDLKHEIYSIRHNPCMDLRMNDDLNNYSRSGKTVWNIDMEE